MVCDKRTSPLNDAESLTTCGCVLWSGPVSSRFDRFLLIGPRAKGAPRYAYQPTQTYTFYRSWLFIVRRGAQFLKRFERPNWFSIFFQRFLKIQYELSLLPPSKYTKTLLYNHLGFQIKQMWPLKVSLQSARSNLKKPCRGPQYFVSAGSVTNENSNELRGFQRPHQNSIVKNRHCSCM